VAFSTASVEVIANKSFYHSCKKRRIGKKAFFYQNYKNSRFAMTPIKFVNKRCSRKKASFYINMIIRFVCYALNQSCIKRGSRKKASFFSFSKEKKPFYECGVF